MDSPVLPGVRNRPTHATQQKRTTRLLSDIFSHVHSAIVHYGYLAVGLGIFLEHFGLPTPGETLLISGAVAASQGLLRIYFLLPLAWLAAVVGNSIGYVIGFNGGHRLLLRYGSRIGITEPRLKQVEALFARYGDFIVVFARFVPILRQFSGIVAGLLEMPWWRFSALNAIGAALWVALWGGVAYFLGKRFYLLSHHFHQHQNYLYAGIVVVVVAVAAFVIWRQRSARH
jgi:membrane protein DedA with SNARE-associated domain